jgi:glycosyltransferase involved in cell wall biosynthesis
MTQLRRSFSRLSLLLILVVITVGTAALAGGPATRPEDIKVTVIIPVYNDIEDVGRAVNSILSQTHRNLEIFVADDHSSQPVFDALVKEFGSLRDPRLHLIRLSRNVGVFSVKNFILKNFATGDFVTSQDSDDYSHPERIQRQVEHALKYNLDAVGIRIRRKSLDGTEKDVYTGYPDRKGPSVTLPLIDSRYTSASIPSDDKAIYRTEYAVRLGGHNGHLRVHGNTDFDGRFARVFSTGAFNEFPLYYWVRRENSLTTSRQTGFSGKKWWLLGNRIPSYTRLKALASVHFSKAAANIFASLGLRDRFLKEIISDLFYPPDLHVEKYQGPGLPTGRFAQLDPLGDANAKWWRDRVNGQPDAPVQLRGLRSRLVGPCQRAFQAMGNR